MIGRTLLALLGIVCLSIGLTTAATAQIAPGRSGSSSVLYLETGDAMGTLTAWGRCYAKKQRPQSLSLIATRASSIEEANVYRKLFRRDGIECLSNETLSASLSLVRGAIAEGLLRAGMGVPPELLQPAPRPSEVRNLSDMARCYVAGHGEQSRALLATKPGSKQEAAALEPMMGDVTACLPSGVQISFDPTVIRFRLAEALLRLAPQSAAATDAGGAK